MGIVVVVGVTFRLSVPPAKSANTERPDGWVNGYFGKAVNDEGSGNGPLSVDREGGGVEEVGDGSKLNRGVGLSVAVGRGVRVKVAVGVEEGVGVAVAVGCGVWVAVGDGVGVAVAVGCGVWVAVGDDVGVAVAVGE